MHDPLPGARVALSSVLLVLAACGSGAPRADVDLSSWHDGPAKTAIVAFVDAVTTPGSPDFVPPAERIAVFDNDGTLWCEKPFYVQMAFALDRVKQLAGDHPQWREQEPFASVLAGDVAGALAGGEHALLELLAATHGGQTADEFAAAVGSWLATARHPQLDRRYPELTYRPMVDLLAYLRAHGFETWIVSGGGVDFLRTFTADAYGVPPQQVIGSMTDARYEVRDGVPAMVKGGGIWFVDDKDGKPVGIHRAIGRRPIVAFGNSDGDFEMLEWTTAGTGRRLGVLVHHDDADREYAYDRESSVGRLARGLDEAATRGWVVVSMRGDWRTVFGDGD